MAVRSPDAAPQAGAAPAFLTTREVAALLRVKERKIYELAAADAIPCRRVTGKLLFPRAQVEAWLAGDRPRPATTPAETRPAPPRVIAGSHDPLLDWAIRESGSRLATGFDGSLDGLERFAAGEALAAGLHVFEPESGGWNVGRVARALPGAPAVMVEWARRGQGLILAPGLAAKIAGVADLRGRRVVRRQPAAGAGLLLDHLLGEAGLTPGDLDFTENLARTESAAAAAVAAGQADAAPGLASMARRYGLDFLPTAEERFDLLIDRRAYFEPPLQALFGFCRGEAFARHARALGGYDLRDFGRVRWNGA